MARGRSKSVVVDRDLGWKQLRKTVTDADRMFVKVGVLEGTPREAGQGAAAAPSNTELAAIHEFGTDRIPERSFIRSSFDKHLAGTTALQAKLAGAFYDGRIPAEKALGLLGLKVATDAKRFITDGEVQPPDSAATLERKEALGRARAEGSPKTLVDTGQLVRSITWSVQKPGAGGGGGT